MHSISNKADGSLEFNKQSIILKKEEFGFWFVRHQELAQLIHRIVLIYQLWFS
jgi:hypothetical protein